MILKIKVRKREALALTGEEIQKVEMKLKIM